MDGEGPGKGLGWRREAETSLDQSLQGDREGDGGLGAVGSSGKVRSEEEVGAACVLSICPLWEFPRAACSLLAP